MVVPLTGVDITVATGGTTTVGAELEVVGGVDTTELAFELDPTLLDSVEASPDTPLDVVAAEEVPDEVSPAAEFVETVCTTVVVVEGGSEVHEVTATKAATAAAAVIR